MSLGSVLKDIGNVLAWPFVHAAKLIEVFNTALKDEPQVKTAVVGLVQKIEALTADGAIAVSAEGLNITEDLQTLVAAQTLWKYVTEVFLPQVEGAFKDVEQDLAPEGSTVQGDLVPSPVATVTADPTPAAAAVETVKQIPIPTVPQPAPAPQGTVIITGPGLHNVSH